MVEPIAENLYCGKSNFKLNNMNGHFTQAFVGKASANPWYSIKTICIDDFIEKHKIEKLNILHSDIQGYEYDMLLGAERSITKGIIDYIFISTHSNELHNTCRDFLINHQYEIIADANLDQTFSFDGLIVGRLKSITGLGKVPIQLKKAA
jgi:hypothetical protein